MRACSPMLTFSASDAISRRQGRITCSYQSLVAVKNGTFFNFSVITVLRRSLSRLRTWSIGSCGNLEKRSMSSKYTRADWLITVERMTSIVSWNRSAGLRIPNCMRMNLYSPWCKVKAVMFRWLCFDLCPRGFFASIRYFHLGVKRLRLFLESQYSRPCVVLDISFVLLRHYIYNNWLKSAIFHSFFEQRQLVQPIPFVRLLSFSEIAFFQIRLLLVPCFRCRAVRSRKYRLCAFVEEFDIMICCGYATELRVPDRLEIGQDVNELCAVSKIWFRDVNFVSPVLG